MDDETDMTAEEFWSDFGAGVPVDVVLTRREYERALGRGTQASAPSAVVISQVTGLGEDAVWMLTGAFSTSGGLSTAAPVRPARVDVGAD
ncbi:hypothetical protein [Iamia sp.]|uniref:hypothetical protein n=1 Tax=Iamia sp. TaxID=2722710 RepID=UPI002C979AD1|nr:hypothetical protein [Iamia sp.]HXH57007.1 hypothetical protein [Iamia sp.]